MNVGFILQNTYVNGLTNIEDEVLLSSGNVSVEISNDVDVENSDNVNVENENNIESEDFNNWGGYTILVKAF
jgi:hypothetical protein